MRQTCLWAVIGIQEAELTCSNIILFLYYFILLEDKVTWKKQKWRVRGIMKGRVKQIKRKNRMK
jgi:hypothetical protein